MALLPLQMLLSWYVLFGPRDDSALKKEIVWVWVLGMEEGKSSISYLQDVIAIVAFIFEVRRFVFIMLNSP